MPGPIFIGGAPRSGLTLFRLMLDGHPAISCGPDTGHIALTMTSADFETTLGGLHKEHFLLDPATVRENFASAIAAPMEKRAALAGKPRWADKTAFNILVFEQLARLFPTAKFIHLVRDGRDVAASLLERRWRAPNGALFDHCASAKAAGRYWAALAARGLAAEEAESLAGRILRIRYEDLAQRPQDAARRLCAFLGEDFAPAMTAIENRKPALAGLELETSERLRQPVNARAVGRWRRDLHRASTEAIYAAHRPIFDRLQYSGA